MTEKSFSLKLNKKEVEILNHGRFKGMVDVLNIIEKKVNEMLDKGEKVEVSTIVTQIVGHKMKANQLANQAAKNLEKYVEEESAKKE